MPSPRYSNQPPPNTLSQPPRRISGFTPAQRVSSIPPRQQGRTFEEQQPEVEIREAGMEEGEPEPRPLTKSGYPDRRFKGQRDLPPPLTEEEIASRARTGGMVGNMHVTIDGKPDRRFKENRGLSDEEVMAKWVDQLQEKYGRPQGRR